MADHDREATIEAVKEVSMMPLQQRLQMMSVVSEWKTRNTSDDNSASASLRCTLLSLASALSATSTLPSSAAPSRNSSRQSHGTAEPCSPANGSPVDNSAHHRSSLPGKFDPTLESDAPANGPPHLPANQFTHQVVNEAINNESPLSQQSPGRPSTCPSEEIKNTSSTEKTPIGLAKWVCPVCGKGCTRADTMKDHIKSQCLNRKIYQCLSCPYSTRKSKADIKKHCKDSAHIPDLGYEEHTPPARNIYASCLAGRLRSTEEELIDDTYQHCKGLKEIPPSNPNIRLRVLLRALLAGPHGKQMEQEINKKCLFWGVDPVSWLKLTWEREDALRLSDMAEYGLQCDAASTSSNRADVSIELAASGLEQYKLGIADLSDYAADLMLSALGNR